jgi:pentatricopeptide repeat protein
MSCRFCPGMVPVRLLTYSILFHVVCCAYAEDITPTFDSVLRKQTLQTTLAVRDYVLSHPDAADHSSACRWLFADVRKHGFEKHVASVVDSVIDQTSIDASIRKAALEVRCVALAKNGNIDEALSIYRQLLKSICLREPDSTIGLARSLANQAQLANRPKVATEVFEALSTAYFLNGYVRDLSKRQVEKYSLFGKPVPQVTGTDVEGNLVDLSAAKGKVVLVDFWATSCAPCLEEFPRLKQIYKRLNARGFEIVGISLDEDPSVVSEFQQRHSLNWPLLMNDDVDPQATSRFKVQKIPSLFLVDRQGMIAAVDIRGVDLEPAILQLLEKALPGSDSQGAPGQ